MSLLTATVRYTYLVQNTNLLHTRGPSWSYGSWIYNYLCNQCLSPPMLWVRIPLRRGVLNTTLCDIVCQWLATGWWFSLGAPVSSINKTERHDITEILLKVALNTINLPVIAKKIPHFLLINIHSQFSF